MSDNWNFHEINANLVLIWNILFDIGVIPTASHIDNIVITMHIQCMCNGVSNRDSAVDIVASNFCQTHRDKMSLECIDRVPDQNVYFKQYLVHPILRIRDIPNFNLYNMMHSTIVKFNKIVQNASWCQYILSITAQSLIVVLRISPQWFLYLISYFHLPIAYKNILSTIYVDWGVSHLSLLMCCALQLRIILSYEN